VIDNIKQGTLKLPDYLLEMFERASLYFQQIGAKQFPEYKVRQIMELHEMAQQVCNSLLLQGLACHARARRECVAHVLRAPAAAIGGIVQGALKAR
jgi:hypothetical protein